MKQFRAACVQLRSAKLPKTNLEAVVSLIKQAADGGANYVQTPEITNISVRNREELEDHVVVEDEDPFIATGRTLACELGIWIHFGSLVIRNERNKFSNRSILISPHGGIVARYDKIHMFDVDLPNGESWRESNSFDPGENSIVAVTPFATIGLSICYDIRFPALYRDLAKAGSMVLAIPAAFTRQTGKAHWHVLQRTRAIENGAFVISAAQGGEHEDGRTTYGHSLIVNPWGEILAEAKHDQHCVIFADIDPKESDEARSKIPALKNERRYFEPLLVGEPEMELEL